MRVAVIIPTTDGPAPILRLTRLVQAPRSVMRTQDDYRPLPPSSRYHAFIQPGGPLAEWIGIGGGQFELRLGAPVDTGRSWELPTALAHCVQIAGHHLDPESAELVVWATGALDNDLSVLGQDYHLPTKLECSEALLKAWLDRGVAVLLLLPEEVTSTGSLMCPLVTVRKVRDLAEAIAAIEEMRPSVQDDEPVISAPKPARRPQHLLAGAAVLMLTGLIWASAELPLTGTANDLEAMEEVISAAPGMVEEASSPHLGEAETDPAPDLAIAQPSEQPRLSTPEASPIEGPSAAVAGTVSVGFLKIVLEQAPEGSSCRSVLFGETVPQRDDLIAVEGAFHASTDGNLCGLGFHLPQTAPAAAQIELSPALADLIIPSDRHVRFSLAPGEYRLFRLRARLPARIEGSVIVTGFGDDPHRLQVAIEGIR